jgi:hypothetical protein
MMVLVEIQSCTGPECSRKPKARLLCGGHYQQFKRGQTLTVLRQSIRSTTRDEEGNKRCSQCLTWKPPSEFYVTRKLQRNTDGRSSYCSRCDRNLIIVRRYGITVDRYDEMLAEQGGGCAICRRPPGATSLHVDHDHKCCPTRKKSCGRCVRGLLCEDCNRGIGMLKDDPELLIRAAEYVKS